MYYTEIIESSYEPKIDYDVYTSFENFVDSCVGFDLICAIKNLYSEMGEKIDNCDGIDEIEQILSETNESSIDLIEYLETFTKEYYDYCYRTKLNPNK